MELIVLLGFVFLVGILRAAGKARPRQPGTLPDGLAGTGPTRAEPSVSDLLAEFRRALEDSQRADRGEPRRLPGPEDEPEFVEDVESLEIEPEIRSLEEEVRRPERVLLDRDKESAEIARTRAKWLTAHEGPITPANHRAFDDRIRAVAAQPEPMAGPVRRPKLSQPKLRQLMVWREILGPPVALRDQGSDAYRPPAPPLKR